MGEHAKFQIVQMNKAKRWADKNGCRVSSVDFDTSGNMRVCFADERGEENDWMKRAASKET